MKMRSFERAAFLAASGAEYPQMLLTLTTSGPQLFTYCPWTFEHAGAARVFDLSNAAYLFAGRAMTFPPRPVLRWTTVDTGIGEHDSNATA